MSLIWHNFCCGTKNELSPSKQSLSAECCISNVLVVMFGFRSRYLKIYIFKTQLYRIVQIVTEIGVILISSKIGYRYISDLSERKVLCGLQRYILTW